MPVFGLVFALPSLPIGPATTNETIKQTSTQGQRGTTKKGVPIMYDIEAKINFAVFPGELS